MLNAADGQSHGLQQIRISKAGDNWAIKGK
jgi:hypothetical protein